MLELVAKSDAVAERVARALARHEYRTPGLHDGMTVNVWRRGPEDVFVEKRCSNHVGAAEAAIAAYRA